MKTPKELVTRARRQVPKPGQPTLQDVLQGPAREAELSPARAAGRNALAALQAQRDTDSTHEYVARQAANQEREQAENDAIMARRITV
jgi:hypothetical protein